VGRSVAFYRDVLGLSVWYDDQIVLSGIGLAAGAKGDRTRLVIMKSEDPVIGMIGLLEFVEPRLAEPAARTRLGVGDIVFVMQGKDVASVHQRAIDFGARVHAAPHRFEVRGADGRMISMTSLSLWDPDDFFIEYNERHE
jgi:catechol 2,3-dioxygenase-like lactoylglutathione lyase family enzyme